jgi:hypothetical protein
VDDREGLHGQHQDEDHHRAAFIKEDKEPRIGTALKITPKTMYETHKKSVLNMTDTPRTTALAHYNNEFADTNLADDDKGFAAALTTNGIKLAITTCTADTLDEELVAAATFATYKEKFNAITALNNYDEEFAIIFALTTYDEEFDDTTPAHYEVKFDAIFADYDGEFIATDNLDEESTNVTLAYHDKEKLNAVVALTNHDEESVAITLAHYDGEFATTDALDEEFTNVTLANYDEERAAALADYDEGVATIHASTKKEAAATFATHDEKIAAVTGEGGGHS